MRMSRIGASVAALAAIALTDVVVAPFRSRKPVGPPTKKRKKTLRPTPGPVGRMTRAIRRGNVEPATIKPARQLQYLHAHARRRVATKEQAA